MARSDHVYVVEYRNMSGNLFLAAFTVKHELATWLYRRQNRNGLHVTRIPDGPVTANGAKVTEMELGPLVEQGYRQAHARWAHSRPEFRGKEPQP